MSVCVCLKRLGFNRFSINVSSIISSRCVPQLPTDCQLTELTYLSLQDVEKLGSQSTDAIRSSPLTP